MNKLVKNQETILCVLKEQDGQAFVIDCVKRTMPRWISQLEIQDYVDCSEEDLYQRTNKNLNRNLSTDERRIAQERFTMIAGILPFVADTKKRNQRIQELAEGKSKQTIRKYLCLYLVYQDLAVLAPKSKDEERKLSADEKNMRWGLNKYFYSKKKHSLHTAYTLMLKEKYCDSQGKLLADHPTFYQFRYFYRKTKNMQHFYISRDGIKHYQRNNRPLLGDGVQSYASAVGTGMLDATVCDIYLVDDTGSVVGRPILTACIDAFSGMCCGYSLGWEGGVYSLRGLLLNVISDKVSWCEKFGVFINNEAWNCQNMPATLITDMGSEYKSSTFEQIAELGVKIVNLPPYRPELKGSVEKFFYVVQGLYKSHLKGKEVMVAYNPDDVSGISLIENGQYVSFDLSESRYQGKSPEEIKHMKRKCKKQIQNVREESLQAQIDLANHNEQVVHFSNHTDTRLK